MQINPEDYGTIYTDSTFFEEGYEEQSERVRQAYPEETKTQQEKAQEQLFDPNSELNQELPGFDPEAPQITDTEIPEDLEDFQIDESIWKAPPQRDVSTETYTAAEMQNFSLNANNGQIDPRERRLSNMIKNHNLDDTLAAFKEINNDPILTEIFDTNNDGKFTYADMFDTSRWNNGEGITDEQDAEFTARWLNAVENKTFAARWSRFGQNLPFVDNKTEFIMDGRFSRLAPVEQVSNWDNNLRAGLLEFGVGTLNLPQQAIHWMSGGRFGGAEGERLGDMYFQTSNPNSMAHLMMTPAKRNWSDRMWHELGYWGSEALLIAGTMGAGAKLTASKQVMNLPKGKRLAMAANKLFTQNITGKTAIRSWTKTGIKTNWVNPSGPWKNLKKEVKKL